MAVAANDTSFHDSSSTLLHYPRGMLPALMAHCTRPENVYQHAWRTGDLAIWDNHATMHSATGIAPYVNDRRLMHRSFVYTLPTARPIPNLDESNAIFMP